MIQMGNTKDNDAVHALEMGFIIVQLLNLLKLTKTLLRNYWEKVRLYKHKDNGKILNSFIPTLNPIMWAKKHTVPSLCFLNNY